MHYLVFVPNQKPLAEVGLADHVAGAQFKQIAMGPGNHFGTLVYWPTPGVTDDKIDYKPDEQDWFPAVARGEAAQTGCAGRYYVGIWRDKPPKPAELKREKIFDGLAVKLNDGQHWVIPSAAKLPRTVKWREDGSCGFCVKNEFASFWEDSERFYWQLMANELDPDAEPGESVFTIDADWCEYVLKALRLNYRMTPEIASALELFDNTIALECVIATLDGQTIDTVAELVSKKNSAFTPDT